MAGVLNLLAIYSRVATLGWWNVGRTSEAPPSMNRPANPNDVTNVPAKPAILRRLCVLAPAVRFNPHTRPWTLNPHSIIRPCYYDKFTGYSRLPAYFHSSQRERGSRKEKEEKTFTKKTRKTIFFKGHHYIGFTQLIFVLYDHSLWYLEIHVKHLQDLFPNDNRERKVNPNIAIGERDDNSKENHFFFYLSKLNRKVKTLKNTWTTLATVRPVLSR